MAIIIKGIKLLTKKGAARLAMKNKPKLDPVKRAANRKRYQRLTKSMYGQKRLTAVGGASTKGPVPIKKQSPVKSTLSGRTYSVNIGTFKRAAAFGAFGGRRSSVTREFQDSVKDLIGLDQISIRKAHKASHLVRTRRQSKLKKK